MGGIVIKSLDDLLAEAEILIILLNSNDFDSNIFNRFLSLNKDINDLLNSSNENSVSFGNNGGKVLLLQEKLNTLSNLLREKIDLTVNKLSDKNKELEYLNTAKKMLLE